MVHEFPPDSIPASVVPDGAGGSILAWVDENYDDDSKYDLWVAVRAPNGAIGERQRLASWVSNYRLVGDPSRRGHVVLAWNSLDPLFESRENDGLYVTTRAPDQGFTSAQRLAPPPQPGDVIPRPEVAAIDGNGRAFVSWNDSSGVATAFRPAGEPFSERSRIGPGLHLNGGTWSAVGATGGGNSILVILDYDVYAYVRVGGGGWRGPVKLNRSAADSGGLSVSANARGAAAVAWTSHGGPRATIVSRMDGTGRFSQPELWADVGASKHLTWPEVGISDEGAVLALWGHKPPHEKYAVFARIRQASGRTCAIERLIVGTRKYAEAGRPIFGPKRTVAALAFNGREWGLTQRRARLDARCTKSKVRRDDGTGAPGKPDSVPPAPEG